MSDRERGEKIMSYLVFLFKLKYIFKMLTCVLSVVSLT